MGEASVSGLEGVVAADTAISHVDGELGRLVIAGADAEALVVTAGFEEAAARVLTAGGAPCDAAAVRAALGRARVEAWARLPGLGDALGAIDGALWGRA